MRFIDVLEPAPTRTGVCFICGGTTPSEHWVDCPLAPEGQHDTSPPDAEEAQTDVF